MLNYNNKNIHISIIKYNILMNIDYNIYINRKSIINNIINELNYFENNKNNLLIKRSIFIYGNHGIGKTTLVYNILKQLNYDIININSNEIKSKGYLNIITKNNLSNNSVLNMFKKINKKKAIVIDEIDNIKISNRGFISELIKIIRPKKTKKQKIENYSNYIIICISNNQIDKKIKELKNVSINIELNTPTNNDIKNIIKNIMPKLNNSICEKSVEYIQNDFRKINLLYDIYINNYKLIDNNLLENILFKNIFSNDTKYKVNNLLKNKMNFNTHNFFINETERTIISLLWHENIIDVLNNYSNNITIPLYINILNNICYGDYIDRITFQKQLWQFNEMTSQIKTYYTNYILHKKLKNIVISCSSIRFTKILTKYSSEYNNLTFIIELSKKLNIDKKDILSYFYYFYNNYKTEHTKNILNKYNITLLEINRIFKFIEFIY